MRKTNNDDMLYIDNYDLKMQRILLSAYGYAYYNYPIKCCLMKSTNLYESLWFGLWLQVTLKQAIEMS